MDMNVTDRISNLPDFVIHHILSFLDSPKDLVRTSVLSKGWFQLTASFPVMIFIYNKFSDVIPDGPSWVKRDTFLKYVEYTVSRFCEQNVSAHTFKLIITMVDPSEAAIIERCIGLILEKGVKVLVSMQHPRQLYRVPNILLSASTLTSMKIRRCELPSFLMVDVIFKSLKVLHLISVQLTEGMINRLTTGCPFLEELAVRDCYGFKKFCVHGHFNLKQVEIEFTTIESIDIDAPNLWFLSLEDLGYTSSPPLMNLTACKKLTKLHFYGEQLPDVSSNFPFLEDLLLVLPADCNLNVSSQSLRKLLLISDCDLDNINVSAPNLLLFGWEQYQGSLFSKENKEFPSKACMECNNIHGFLNDFWFKMLRKFLGRNTGFKELKLHISVGTLLFTELKLIQWPPFELEHVELTADTHNELFIYETVVDSLLWCCRPQSLTLKLDFSKFAFEDSDSIVKYTYEKLLLQEDRVHTKIQFVMSSSSSNAKLIFSDLSTLLTALPRDGSKRRITFIKREVVQDAGEGSSLT